MMERLAAAILAAFLSLPSAASSAAADFPPLFDTLAYGSDSLDALPQWRRVLSEVEAERSAYQLCADALGPCESRALLAWQAMIKGQEGAAPLDQLHAVNRFVNQWPSRSDRSNYGRDDHWVSPLAFLRRGGDCEDHAIIKYVSLRQLGFEPERLRLTVVRDALRDVVHAVLAVHVDDQVWILDNLYQAVLPQERVSQYLPYYSVNETARFAHLPPSGMLLASSPFDVAPSAYSLD